MPCGALMIDPWVKVVHVLAIVSWMAGLFYLPRLFVYHAEAGAKAGIADTFGVMERRLLKAIMRPAGAVTLGSGVLLVWAGGWHDPVPLWLWLKLLLVAGLGGYHGVLERHAVRFQQGLESGTSRYFRVLNEVPTVLLIGIVILVIVKPF